MKIIAFGASASKASINKAFAEYAATQFQGNDIEVLDLNDYTLPLYTVDVEGEIGIPAAAKVFNDKLAAADFIIVSVSEHNGTYTAVFKNLFDWLSRHNLKMFADKKMLLLSTAPGGRGGQGAMDAALNRFPRHGAEVLGHFALPFFQKNFDATQGITDTELHGAFTKVLESVKAAL